MRDNWRRRFLNALALSIAMMAITRQIGTVSLLPGKIVLHTGSVTRIPVSMAVSACVDAPGNAILNLERQTSDGSLKLTAGEAGQTRMTFKLLGLFPVASMDISVENQRRLIPGGQSIGVALRSSGVVVVGASDIGNSPSPARLAGLKPGDIIAQVNGQSITSAAQLPALIGAETACLKVFRNQETLKIDVEPQMDHRDGIYRLGIWVRDSTAGVGTLTFYDPANQNFGALGHAITDVDTGIVMPVGKGALYENSVVAVTPGQKGRPGELTGDFFLTNHAIGQVSANSECGIFGQTFQPLENSLYPDGLPAATRSEVHPGSATLLTTLADGQLGQYDCEIVRINPYTAENTRSMVVRITDPALLNKTGGIVQGMSGSPIVQDGKLVGAVTHVLVNDPTTGYGIFIENMLEAAG